MGYILKTISTSEWTNIQERTVSLKSFSVRKTPRELAINQENGNFLIEIDSWRHRDEWGCQCAFISSVRSLRVGFSDFDGKYIIDWCPLSAIPVSEILPTSPTSCDLTEAVKVLYKTQDRQIIVRFSAGSFG